MQIFVRFAFGLVITVDICKGTTTVKQLMEDVNKKLKLHDFLYDLILRKGKVETMLSHHKEELVCKNGRVTKNDIIEFEEINKDRKFKEVRVKYYERTGSKEQKSEFKTIPLNINDVTPFTLIGDLKIKIKDATGIDRLKQPVFYGNIELANENLALHSYGIQVYEVLNRYYQGDSHKLNKIDELNTIEFVCIERMVDVFTVKMCNHESKDNLKVQYVDTNDKVLGLKKMALSLFEELGNPPIDLATQGNKIKMYIGTEEIHPDTLTVFDLKQANKIKNDIVISFKRVK